MRNRTCSSETVLLASKLLKSLAIAVLGSFLLSGCSQKAGIPDEVVDAIRHQDLARLEVAINASPNAVNARDKKDGFSPLSVAVQSEFPQGAQFLLSKGADPNGKWYLNNEPGSASMTPLMWAVYKKDDEFVVLLLKAGANPNAPCGTPGKEMTPLLEAVSQDNVEIASLLLAGKGDPNAQVDGLSALDLARHGNDAMMVDLLESAGKSGGKN